MRCLYRSFFTILLISLPFLAASQTRERGLSVKVGATGEDLTSNRPVNLWAVVIGVSRYKLGDQNINGNHIPNLKNAAEDATEVYKFLRSPEGGSFPESNISLLVDDQATKANIEAALEKLKQSKPDDYFVVFIAAHGVIWKERGAAEEYPYFLVYDTNPDPTQLAKTSLRMESFKRAVNSIPAKKGLVISDTCHSGGVMLESGSRGLAVTQRANNQWLDTLKEIPRGIGYLSAADQNESSLERDDLGHGVFTYCLLEAVRGNADFDGDGKVTFEELRTYVRDEVPKMTDNRQHPQYATSMLSANNLPLSVVTYPEVGKCSAASPCGTLRITNPEIEGVEVSIDDKPLGRLTAGGQRTVRVPIGERRLTLAKGPIKQTQPASIIANKTTSYEINAAFTESNAEEVVEQTTQQKTISLGDEKAPTKEAEKKLQEGVDLFNKQKFREAITLFNEAVRLNGGGYHQAFTYRGRAEQSLGLKEDAIKSFTEALAVRPTDYQTKTLLAEAKFNAGRNTEEIVADLRAVNKRYPLYDFAYVVLGDVLFARGDKIGAEKALRKAIGINPKFPPARMILAHVLMSKDPAAKFVDLGKEVNALPFKEATEQAEEALRLFNEVAKKRVSALKAAKYMSISHLIFGGGRYEDSSALAEANYILAKAYTRYAGWEEGNLPDAVRMNYIDKARVNIQEALRLSSSDKMRQFLALWLSADNAFLKGDSPRAIKDAEAALKLAETMPNTELSGDKFEIYTILYQAFYTTQEYTKAAESLRKGLAIYGNRLAADDRQRITDMLREAEEKGKANRKKK
ncbi:MAG TPA: caspase family protein [Blastocatellia bacterium]|nr:caspase family protein [Blastocatellia bacterium]